MNREKFEELVSLAIDGLPEEFLDALENIDIIVEDEPTAEQLGQHAHGDTLLGLYEGVPMTERTSSYGLVLPDKITLFRKPIEECCRNDREIAGEIRDTLRHEIAHYFGIDDDRLDELGR